MNPVQARAAALVMLAWADGKKIQIRLKGGGGWHPVGQNPEWNWEVCDYRVAPAPVAFRVYARTLNNGVGCPDVTSMNVVYDPDAEKQAEKLSGFAGWTGPWQTFQP